jgi:hypothetical protein
VGPLLCRGVILVGRNSLERDCGPLGCADLGGSSFEPLVTAVAVGDKGSDPSVLVVGLSDPKGFQYHRKGEGRNSFLFNSTR